MQPAPGSAGIDQAALDQLHQTLIATNGALRGITSVVTGNIRQTQAAGQAALQTVMAPLGAAVMQPLATGQVALQTIKQDALLGAVNALAESQVTYSSLSGVILSTLDVALAQAREGWANIPFGRLPPAQLHKLLADNAPDGPPADAWIKVSDPQAPGSFVAMPNRAFDPSLSPSTNPALRFVPQPPQPPPSPPPVQPTITVPVPGTTDQFMTVPNPAYVAPATGSSASPTGLAPLAPQFAPGSAGSGQTGAAAAMPAVVNVSGGTTPIGPCGSDPAFLAAWNAAHAGVGAGQAGFRQASQITNWGPMFSGTGLPAGTYVVFTPFAGQPGNNPSPIMQFTLAQPGHLSQIAPQGGELVAGPFCTSPPPPPPSSPPPPITFNPPPPLPPPPVSPPPPPTCPPPPPCPPGSPPPTIPGTLTPVSIPDWNNPDVCTMLGGIVNAALPTGSTWFSFALGLRNAQGIATTPPLLAAVKSALGSVPVVGSSLASALGSGLVAITDAIGGEVNSALQGNACSPVRIVPTLVVSSLMGFASKWLGIDFGPIQVAVDQWKNWTCPQQVPSAGDALDLFVTQQIDQPTFECWVRANGLIYDDYAKLVEIRRSKFDAFQSVEAWRRGIFDTPKLLTQLNSLGWNQTDDLYDLTSYTEQIPPVGDLIRFMVREVYDATYTATFDTNAEFATKYNGQIVQWAQAQGLTLEHVQAEWRAHWMLPAVGQVLDMYQRLRPGVVDPSIEVTEQAVDEVLAANDVLPYWRQRFKAMAYNPLSRVDARRAFSIRTIDSTQLYNSVRDQGYNDTNAQILVDFYTRLRDLTDFKSYTGWTPGKILKYYKSGAISEDKARQLLAETGASFQSADTAITLADLEEEAIITGKRVEVIHKRYKLYEFDQPTCTNMLTQLGIDLPRANQFIGLWNDEKGTHPKQATASVLCKWLKAGLVTAPDFALRMLRAGWTADDVTRIVTSCQMSIAADALKQQEAAAKAQKTAQDKAAKDQQLAAEKLQKNLDKMTKEQRAEHDRRQKAIDHAAKDAQRAAEKAARDAAKAKKAAQPPKPKQGPEPSEAMIARWFGAALIDETAARALLYDEGWEQDDVDLIIAEAMPKYLAASAAQTVANADPTPPVREAPSSPKG